MMDSIYSSLDPGKRETRVLTIDDQMSNTILVACKLNTVSLDDEPEYAALSYCWGAPEPTGKILINDIPWTVTPNLAVALEHFRKTKDAQVTPIWIDALCINQRDLRERSAQVAMMMSIYAQAQGVHLWLANELGSLSDAMATLEEVSTISHDSDDEMVLRADNMAKTWHQQSELHVAHKLNQIIHIARNPYWQRAWILQEVSFAKNVVIHASGSRLDLKPSIELDRSGRHVALMHLNKIFERLSTAIQKRFERDTRSAVSVHRAREVRGLTDRMLNMLSTVVRVNWNRAIVNTSRLEGDIGAGMYDASRGEIFLVYRKMLSSDAKDKIYGLLGFVGEFRELMPDYQKSTRTIYCEATIRLLRAARELNYLHQACSGNEELPSWVPDYSKPCAWPGLAIVEHSAEVSLRTDTTEAVVKFDMDAHGRLFVKGLIFDEITFVRSHIPFDPTDPAALQDTWNSWVSVCPALLQKLPVRDDLETRIAVLYGYVSYESLGSISEAAEQIDSTSEEEMANLMTNFELFTSGKGFVGITPKGLISSGDRLAIIAGASLPFAITIRPAHEGKVTLRLRAPVVVDGNVIGPYTGIQDDGWTKHAALAKHTAWIQGKFPDRPSGYGDGRSIMQGAVVIAEALRRFNDPDKIDEVFEDLTIV